MSQEQEEKLQFDETVLYNVVLFRTLQTVNLDQHLTQKELNILLDNFPKILRKVKKEFKEKYPPKRSGWHQCMKDVAKGVKEEDETILEHIQELTEKDKTWSLSISNSQRMN